MADSACRIPPSRLLRKLKSGALRSDRPPSDRRTQGLVDCLKHGPRTSLFAEPRSARCAPGSILPKRLRSVPARFAPPVAPGYTCLGQKLRPASDLPSPGHPLPLEARHPLTEAVLVAQRRPCVERGRSHVTANHRPIGGTSGRAATVLSPALPGALRPPAPGRATRPRRGRGVRQRSVGGRGGPVAAAGPPLGDDTGH
jgi:hypothetical protein